MVEGFVVLKVDVKTIFDSNLHLHGHHLGRPFHFLIREQNCKICLLYYIELPCHHNSDEIPDSSCHSFKGLVLFLKVWESKLEGFVF